MAVDASIYSQNMPDVAGSFERGFSLADTISKKNKARKEEQRLEQVNKAYEAGVIQNPDGSVSFDGNLTVSQLANAGLGREAYEAQNTFRQKEAEDLKLKRDKINEFTDFIARSSDAIKKDPGLYNVVLSEAKTRGYDTSGMPQMWGPDAQKKLDFYYGQGLTFKDQIENQIKQRGFEADQKWKAEDNRIKREELGIKRSEAQKKSNSGDNLPLDAKKFVETTATKNANKVSIKNTLDSFIEQWDNWTPDQRLTQGRQLLKTINSPEGADAIGAEEANRLGSKLEFAMGNLFNSNPTQFGRDLDGFFTQVKDTSSTIGGSIDRNKQMIDQAMGRTSADKPNNQGIKQGHVEDGYVFLGGDPSNSKNWKKR